MIYFTSDLHLGHRGIIAMRNRPFADVEEMNRILIANFNAVVHKDDTVYILGDFAHHMQVEDINKIIGKLNGRKILIKVIMTKNMMQPFLKKSGIFKRFP